jgi:hypothetical protein
MIDLQRTFIVALASRIGNGAFYAGIAATGAVTVAALVLGIARFRNPLGRVLAIAAGTLLAALVAFVLFVLLTSGGAGRGKPL